MQPHNSALFYLAYVIHPFKLFGIQQGLGRVPQMTPLPSVRLFYIFRPASRGLAYSPSSHLPTWTPLDGRSPGRSCGPNRASEGGCISPAAPGLRRGPDALTSPLSLDCWGPDSSRPGQPGGSRGPGLLGGSCLGVLLGTRPDQSQGCLGECLNGLFTLCQKYCEMVSGDGIIT